MAVLSSPGRVGHLASAKKDTPLEDATAGYQTSSLGFQSCFTFVWRDWRRKDLVRQRRGVRGGKRWATAPAVPALLRLEAPPLYASEPSDPPKARAVPFWSKFDPWEGRCLAANQY